MFRIFFVFCVIFYPLFAYNLADASDSKNVIESKDLSQNIESNIKDSAKVIESNLQNPQDSIESNTAQSIAKDSIESKTKQDSKDLTKNINQENHYSIMQDLESALNIYVNAEIPKDLSLSFYKIYDSLISPFSTHIKNTQNQTLAYNAQNPFAPQTQESQTPQAQPQTPETQNKPQTQANQTKPTHLTNQTLPSLYNNAIDIKTLSPKCQNQTFTLKKENNLNVNEILNFLAKTCDFSLQYYSNKESKIQTHISSLNVENKRLDFILALLLSDTFYDIKPFELVLKEHEMLIYELNYVSSTRMAQSNTDVLFSQEQNNFNGNYTGYGGYSGYSGYGGYGLQSYQPPPLNTTQTPQNLRGYLDNLTLKNQLRNQMTYANTNFGKSGTKIYSLDEINFWADVESKLGIVLETRKGDRFMIDKGAGLISIWTNKPKMKEVVNLLNNLESKMNLQVAIDVEILSLTHFNASNIGIDWQEIFKILNPSSSAFNLAVSGGSNFSITNANINLNPLFNLLKTYGNLRSLSNPKIMALNNQPAIISVGSVLRYSQNLVFQSNNTTNTIQNTSTQYPSVFSGILLDITPSISLDSIILRINPSITKTKDPELENTSQALNSPPNLSTNQLSTIVKLKNGERVIIGGLLNNITQNSSQALPGIGEVRILDRIFGKQSRLARNEELIIIITPHIIRD